jgi:hypothetical protein
LKAHREKLYPEGVLQLSNVQSTLQSYELQSLRDYRLHVQECYLPKCQTPVDDHCPLAINPPNRITTGVDESRAATLSLLGQRHNGRGLVMFRDANKLVRSSSAFHCVMLFKRDFPPYFQGTACALAISTLYVIMKERVSSAAASLTRSFQADLATYNRPNHAVSTPRQRSYDVVSKVKDKVGRAAPREQVLKALEFVPVSQLCGVVGGTGRQIRPMCSVLDFFERFKNVVGHSNHPPSGDVACRLL